MYQRISPVRHRGPTCPSPRSHLCVNTSHLSVTTVSSVRPRISPVRHRGPTCTSPRSHLSVTASHLCISASHLCVTVVLPVHHRGLTCASTHLTCPSPRSHPSVPASHLSITAVSPVRHRIPPVHQRISPVRHRISPVHHRGLTCPSQSHGLASLTSSPSLLLMYSAILVSCSFSWRNRSFAMLSNSFVRCFATCASHKHAPPHSTSRRH